MLQCIYLIVEQIQETMVCLQHVCADAIDTLVRSAAFLFPASSTAAFPIMKSLYKLSALSCIMGDEYAPTDFNPRSYTVG